MAPMNSFENIGLPDGYNQMCVADKDKTSCYLVELRDTPSIGNQRSIFPILTERITFRPINCLSTFPFDVRVNRQWIIGFGVIVRKAN